MGSDNQRKQYVGGVIFDGSRVLLGRRAALRKHYPGVWDIFGGHLERGETEHAALFREMREELGIQVRKFRHAGELAGSSHSDSAFFMSVYLVTDWSGHLRLGNNEHDEIRWFYPGQLTHLPDISDPRLPQLVQLILRETLDTRL